MYIYAPGPKAETVPEPISSGDGPLLFLNLSFWWFPSSLSPESCFGCWSLHSSSSFLVFFSSLFHRCSDFISLLSSLSLVGLSYSRISAQHPLIYNQRKHPLLLGLDLFCLRLLEFTVTTISAGPCRLVPLPLSPPPSTNLHRLFVLFWLLDDSIKPFDSSLSLSFSLSVTFSSFISLLSILLVHLLWLW